METGLASVTILVPLATAVVCGLISVRWATVVGMVGSVATAGTAAALCRRVAVAGTLVEPMGGWAAPLGIELRVDGFGALMVATTAVVGLFVSLYSVGYFRGSRDEDSQRAGHHQGYFWALWLVVWASLNGIFVSGDLFNIYVGIEVMGLASVALVALAGPAALRAAMQYLFVTLAGSLLYLLGVALLYGGWGVVDIVQLGAVVEAGTTSRVALGVMTLGLALKTALVPLHFWLPAAHSSAPAPVSAVLSGLVVKASYYVLVRLWLDVFEVVDTSVASMVVATLGAVALVWGAVQAVRQSRLKMLVAYSTVAQIGYLFVAWGPATVAGVTDQVWRGVALFILAHGCAKGAMFLAAGAMAQAMGGDRFSRMRDHGLELALPMLAFGLAGLGLVGLPPSGGYVAKGLLSAAAEGADMQLVGVVLEAGGVLAAIYLLKVVYFAFAGPAGDEGGEGEELGDLPATMVVASLGLAVVAAGIGLAPEVPMGLLEAGAPFGG